MFCRFARIRFISIQVLVGVIFLGSVLSACTFFKADMSVEQWRMIEITLTSRQDYTNPFLEVEVNAIFTGPQGEVITRPAFWDGGKIWKIRFAPTRTGLWKYTTSSTPADKGLYGKTGTIQAIPYLGKLPIYQHGFLKVSENRRYLVYADGTPFFYLGDTHWFMPHEKWDSCNKPGCTSQFKYIVDRRVTQKFTVYQSEPHPMFGQAWNKGVTEVYPEQFVDIDRKFQYIADQGLVHATALGCHSQALDLTAEGAARLARYWTARYGAYPVLWFTAQEFDAQNLAFEAVWKEAAKAFALQDAYHHPITGHYYTTALGQAVKYWGEEPWHSYYMLQNGHNRQTRLVFYRDYWNQDPPKPFLESEANYDDILNHAVNSRAVRISAYMAIQSGSLGFGYGANGIWNDIYELGDEGCCVKDYGLTLWSDAVDFESADQMTYLYQFYTALDWWKLEPRFIDSNWAKFANPERSVLKSEGNRVYVVYFSNTTHKTGTLKQMDDSTVYTARWYNPRDGKYLEISSAVKSSTGEWEIPLKPDEQDWLLIVTAVLTGI